MTENKDEYICLVNDSDQYSLWPSWKEIPNGWKRIGPKGNKEIILTYVKETWVDMTPKELR